MQNISYFCIVKCFNRILRSVLLTISALCITSSRAQSADSLLLHMDSVEIGLLTCGPGQEIYSLYGHTAIHYHDLTGGEDLAINYGLFSFKQSGFIPRFVFGLTDYQMGIMTFAEFCAEYAGEGRWVKEQKLNLTRKEKLQIAMAMVENYQPQNRTYRYNYFYDNCTTRARDIIANHIDGDIEYAASNNTKKTTYREMVHRWNENHRWARFGNDILLGVKADADIDFTQQQFLPYSLYEDFATAKIYDGARKRPLVSSTVDIIRPHSAQQKDSGIWDTLSPTVVFTILLIVVMLWCLLEYRLKRQLWLFDLTLLTLNGLAGLVLLAMVFSKHPTVSLNFQILLLNPLSIVFVYKMADCQIHQKCHWYAKVLSVCIILFAFLGFFQHYAEGMWLLALSLLIRMVFDINYNKFIKQK